MLLLLLLARRQGVLACMLLLPAGSAQTACMRRRECMCWHAAAAGDKTLLPVVAAALRATLGLTCTSQANPGIVALLLRHYGTEHKLYGEREVPPGLERQWRSN